LLEIDLTYHETLCKLADNQRLLDAWQSQISQVRMLLALSGSMDYDMRNMIEGHCQILEAIRDHDLETAQSLLETQICLSRDRLLQRRDAESD
jgi:DNA-binding GntR family transcriptional regulator